MGLQIAQPFEEPTRFEVLRKRTVFDISYYKVTEVVEGANGPDEAVRVIRDPQPGGISVFRVATDPFVRVTDL